MTTRDRTAIGVIDIFAGPGGLGEGFASFTPDGTSTPAFGIGVSAEMEPSAHATLRLRAFFRKMCAAEGPEPRAYRAFVEDWIADPRLSPVDRFSQGPFAALWREADHEALNLTLGVPDHDRKLYERIDEVRARHDRLVVIGGPPCQAYSLVGRARNAKIASFRRYGDHRHFLYREYLGILAKYEPDVFIMENVKGLLTSRVGDWHMLGAILADLAHPAAAGGFPTQGPRYVIVPLTMGDSGARDPEEAARNPSRFLLHAEDHGVAQARHRVVLMGVREDLAHRAVNAPGIRPAGRRVTLAEALSGLPKLRSGLSTQDDSPDSWRRAVDAERDAVIRATRQTKPDVAELARAVMFDSQLARESSRLEPGVTGIAASLSAHAGGLVPNHATRGHMPSDLGRYLYCALHGAARSASPSATEFPDELAPRHKNWGSGHFADRFRVQLQDQPSSTITSHLSKDGHAFIHPDPAQCRSLTVREAARLQSFPDNYLFLGNRTQQYVQVGNAVPPLLARQIAADVHRLLS